MSAFLIYIHIEKSAGTSQRHLFYRNYGRSRVFWYGVGSAKASFDRAELGDCKVVGGHRDHGFYASVSRQTLFASVVREPVARVVSLFNYYAQTSRERTEWLKRGLNPDSLLDTIVRCGPFRQNIANTQCLRLGDSRNFERALEVLRRDNFIVGCFEHLDRFNSELAIRLGWRYTDLDRHNVGRDISRRRVLDEEGVVEKILELNREDQKLYEFVKGQQVYVNIRDDDTLLAALHPDYEAEDISPVVGGADVKCIRLSLPGQIRAREPLEVPATISVNVENRSSVVLKSTGDAPVKLGFHWYTQDGGSVVDYEGNRVILPRDIPPGQRDTVELRLLPKRTTPSGDYLVRIGLLQIGIHWFESYDKDHLLPLRVIVQ